ncbi:P-loop containing nucleoside triphosphate hydrolase protein, partial [Neocallimastix californiae]
MDSRHDNTFNPYIQEDPKDQKKTVQIKNIRKIFKVKGESIEILQNINFNAYYNEIFAILGHNGAGKTTLMNIMTGIISSTSGEIYYDNIPISGIHVDIDSVLKNIDLLSKKNNFPKELSGGQRRKLCITLAFLGSPKYVFLDEPTTGLDPYSRKNIWELLLEKKEGRTIFVTTHYMDEADLLADRKMIISNGKISCLGSSLFLKQQFNMNYSIDINCKDIRD